MWKNPRLLTDVTGAQIGAFFAEDPSLVYYQPSDRSDPVIDQLLEIVESVAISYAAGSQSEFLDSFFELVTTESARIVETKSYYEIEELNTAVWLVIALSSNDSKKNLGLICSLIVNCITAMIGSETKILVGIKNNIPAFRELGHKMTEPYDIALLVSTFPLMLPSIMHHVGQDDTWMVPTPSEWSLDLPYRGDEYLEFVEATLAAALENQCYTVHPQGVQIKLSAGNINGMWLKVVPKPKSPYMSILARVDSSEQGSYFTVVDEEAILGPSENMPRTPAIGSYVVAMIAQVYHDLVTVKETAGSSRGPKTVVQDGIPVFKSSSIISKTTVPWTAIPRRTKRTRVTETGARQPVLEPKMKNPHFVCGHPRKGNMTERQREEIRKFEASTGLQILARLAPDKTYVLPHMSPMPESAEQFNSLPRFVRAGIHKALEEGLRNTK